MELWHGDLPDFIKAPRAQSRPDGRADAAKILQRAAPAPSRSTAAGRSRLRRSPMSRTKRQTDDIGVLVEYHLPLSERRIDVMLFGRGTTASRTRC